MPLMDLETLDPLKEEPCKPSVNPGEAKQIEQDYAHTTLASSEMALDGSIHC
jgi:hypothetical protein